MNRTISHTLETQYGNGILHTTKPSGSPVRHLEHGSVVFKEPTDGMLVRIHSRCMYSEALFSQECDCGAQMRASLRLISEAGGVYIYLDQEGRGAGLAAKAAAYQLRESRDLDTYAAYSELGLPGDLRDYDEAVRILKAHAPAVKKVRLLTNNPAKVSALEAAGYVVHREPLLIKPTPATMAYLESKRRQGHLIPRAENHALVPYSRL